MFNPKLFDNSRSDGFPVMEVEGAPADEPRQFVPLRRTELTGAVAGPLADLRLLQTFGYSREACDKTLEAVYRFPLPGDAAVTGVTVRFGDVEITAELKEWEQAEADYEEAKRTGRQAALATRESPDVFTLRVAGLQPDQEIRVETAYVQLARMEGDDWSLRLPLTTAPRYVRIDEANSRHAEGQPLALLRDPGHRFALDLGFPDAGAVASPTHALDTESGESGVHVRLKEGDVLPDRDCLLTWRPAQERQHPALHLHLFDDAAEQSVYFLALVTPPAEKPAARVPRESILLVDHSGSMSGPKWDAADWAVKQFLNGLEPRDSLALGLFHNSCKWFANRPKRADAGTVSAAIDFLERNRDSGGTELGVALEQALAQERTGEEMSRHVLVLTDAEVSDAGRILRLADAEAERTNRRRISVLCIDAAPNAFLARELAERGGGTASFLTSRPEEEDVTTALDRILADWSAPILTGLRLEINRSGAQAVGRTASASRERGSAVDIGDLPAGRAVWVAGRVPRGDSDDLAFRLVASDGREIAARRCDLAAKSSAGPAVKALFGASRVLALEFLTTGYYEEDQLRSLLERLGYAASDLQAQGDAPKLYAENVQRSGREGLKALLVREALRYGIACSETAFIAVRKEAGKLIEETSVVANALPAGWSDEFLSAPAAMAMATPPMAMQPSMPVQAMYRGVANVSHKRHATLRDLSSDLSAAANGVVGALGDALKRASRIAPPADPTSTPPFLQRQVELAGRASSGSVLFAGVPAFTGPTAVLFDTARPENASLLGSSATFTRLRLTFAGGPLAGAIDPGLTLLVYLDDMVSPRARVRLADLLKQGGERPINLRRANGEPLRLALEDPNGAWATNAPQIELTLV